MAVYGVVFCLTVILSLFADRSRRVMAPRSSRGVPFSVLVITLLLVGVSALRWRVGTDYWSYEESFRFYAKEAETNLNLAEEPGLKIIAWIGLKFVGDPAAMFAIAALITIGLTIPTLWRWSPVFGLSAAFYILTGAWHGSFNGVRQYLAGAILFAGHRYIIDRKPWKWIAIVLVASLFHSSAVVAVFFYFLPTTRSRFQGQLIILILAVVSAISMDFILAFLESFTDNSTRWGGSYAERSVNPLRIAFHCLPIILFWMLDVTKKVKDDGAHFYVNIMVVHAAIYIAALNSALIARFAIYTLPFLAIGLVYITWLKDPKERVLLRLFVMILYALFMISNIYMTDNLRDFQWLFERP